MAKINTSLFVKKYSEIFALNLGMIIFYNFAEASNPAVKSFLWLFSSIIVIYLFAFLSLKALSFETTWATKIMLGVPLFLLDMVFTMQVIISLFEPGNIYALNLVNAFSSLSFWITAFWTAVFLVVIMLIIYFFSRIKK